MVFGGLFSVKTAVVYLCSFLVAFLFALSMPTLSVYVAKTIDVRPFLVGLFFVAVAIASIVYAQILGHISDRLSDRRPLIAICMLSGALACVLFSQTQSYIMALGVGLTFYSFAFASIAQIFAYSRDFSDFYLPEKSAVMFNSVVRASAALAWVSGPPLGFLLFDRFSFEQYYQVVSVIYILTAIFSVTLLVNILGTEKKSLEPEVEAQAIFTLSNPLLLSFIAFSILYASNHSYLIALPLFLSEHLGLSLSSAGLLMGTAAALEIPVMLLAGWLGSRYSLLPLMIIGALSSMVLHFGIWQSTQLWQLFVLQIFNAVFIGFIAALGISWFQNHMPNRAGAASALYMNTTNVGCVIGSLMIAAFAEILGYREVFMINGIAAFLAVILLFLNQKTISKN